MNSHTLSEAKNQNYTYSKNKRDGKVPNVSEMEDTGLHDSVDIEFMLPVSTLNQ